MFAPGSSESRAVIFAVFSDSRFKHKGLVFDILTHTVVGHAVDGAPLTAEQSRPSRSGTGSLLIVFTLLSARISEIYARAFLSEKLRKPTDRTVLVITRGRGRSLKNVYKRVCATTVLTDKRDFSGFTVFRRRRKKVSYHSSYLRLRYGSCRSIVPETVVFNVFQVVLVTLTRGK